METLCIVPCGNKKIWDKFPNAGPTRAEDVYIGALAIKCKEYAKMFYPSSWCILSAKYGFLMPNDIVPENYNVSFNKAKTNPITIEKLSAQMEEKGLDKYKKIVALVPRNYLKVVKKVFSSKEVLNPLIDCKGIGYMMERINNLIKSRVQL